MTSNKQNEEIESENHNCSYKTKFKNSNLVRNINNDFNFVCNILKYIYKFFRKYPFKIIIFTFLIFFFNLISCFVNFMIDNNEWFGNFGSYIAAAVTLFVLWKTTKETRKVQEENRKNTIEPSLILTFPLLVKFKLIKNNNDFSTSFDPPNDFSIVNLSNNGAHHINLIFSINRFKLIETLKSLFANFEISPENYDIKGFKSIESYIYSEFNAGSKQVYLDPCRYILSNGTEKIDKYYLDLLFKDESTRFLINKLLNRAVESKIKFEEFIFLCFNVRLEYKDVYLYNHYIDYSLDLKIASPKYISNDGVECFVDITPKIRA